MHVNVIITLSSPVFQYFIDICKYAKDISLPANSFFIGSENSRLTTAHQGIQHKALPVHTGSDLCHEKSNLIGTRLKKLIVKFPRVGLKHHKAIIKQHKKCNAGSLELLG
jgi:hypothetical protein